MADKIAKLLQKIPPKQLQLLLPVLKQIVAHDFEGLDVKTLKGHKGLYRARVGNCRVVFNLQNSQEPKIVSIAKRDEKTYKNL